MKKISPYGIIDTFIRITKGVKRNLAFWCLCSILIYVKSNTKEQKCHYCNEVRHLKEDGKTTTTREFQSPYCKPCTGIMYKQGIKYPINHWLEQRGYSSSAPYTLYCDCGSEQTYSTKYALVRALLTSGKCGECSSSMSRQWNQDTRDKVWLSMRNTTLGINCKTIDELKKHPKWIARHNTKEYKRYRGQVDDITKRNLRRDKPELYKQWQSYKYSKSNGYDYKNGLTIDHIKEVRWCFDNGISARECADISNLQVITMKENFEKSRRIQESGYDTATILHEQQHAEYDRNKRTNIK